MRLLSLSPFYHDGAAALVADGRIIAAAREERFSVETVLRVLLKYANLRGHSRCRYCGRTSRIGSNCVADVGTHQRREMTAVEHAVFGIQKVNVPDPRSGQ